MINHEVFCLCHVCTGVEPEPEARGFAHGPWCDRIDPDRLARALGRITQDTPGALAMADQENTYPALALVAAAIAKAYEEDVLPEIEEPEVPSGGPD